MSRYFLFDFIIKRWKEEYFIVDINVEIGDFDEHTSRKEG